MCTVFCVLCYVEVSCVLWMCSADVDVFCVLCSGDVLMERQLTMLLVLCSVGVFCGCVKGMGGGGRGWAHRAVFCGYVLCSVSFGCVEGGKASRAA